MAANAVQATPELLEMILLELPTKDLLLAQRVAKGWQETIIGSNKIQRALFLQPVFKEPLVCQDYRTENRRWRSRWIINNSQGPGLPFTIYENPLLLPLITAANSSTTQNDFTDGLPVSWTRPEASWRSMLLTQPSFEGPLQLFEQKGSGDLMRGREAVLLTRDDRAGDFARKGAKLKHGRPERMTCLLVEGWDLWEDVAGGDEIAELRRQAMVLRKRGLLSGE